MKNRSRKRMITSVLLFFSMSVMSCAPEVVTTKPPVDTTVVKPAAESYVRISPQNKAYLQLTNGDTFIPIGINTSFIRQEDKEEVILQKYEHYFQETAKYGGNFARIWLSAPAFEIENKKIGVYDSVIAQRVDKLVALAEKYQIRLKLCFEHFRDLTGYPAPFVYSLAFDKPFYAVKNGGKFKDMPDYINSKEGRAVYLNRAAFWLNRYANKPIIFGWELWNEMEHTRVPTPAVEAWMKEIFPGVKKLAPNHLVMQSMGSMSTSWARSIYKTFSAIPDNSIAQVHRYLDMGAELAVCRGPMDELAADAINDLRSFNLDKPIVLAETSAVEPNHSGPSKLFDKDVNGILFHDLLFAPFFSGSAAPGQSWYWDFYVDKNNLWYHLGRFSQAIKGFDPVKENAKPYFSNGENQLKIYSLLGTGKDLVWIRDGENNWQTELVNGKAPRVVKSQKFKLESGVVRVEFYDPWKQQWTKGEIKNNATILPDFSRSIVVRVEKM
ncbi:glycoside hydrolase family 5 protein [Emticicia fluvialis]|uniref:glycoside hydrolase family 5 protein n=1 Tax=Emticicia fluvialis TaxID=2974474 RepID=UPI002164FE79|nr:glycoside hydrolase family 5 protein [Emticicia fluvialis]